MAELMATSIATGLKDALAPILTRKIKQTPSGVVTAAGVGVKTDGERSLEGVLQGKVKVSRYDRGEGASKEKLLTRLCEPLKHKFQAVDALKLMDPDSDVDVASMTLDMDTVIKCFTDWVISNDGWSLFQVPNGITDPTDLRSVLNASTHSNLLTEYNTISLSEIKAHQTFINTRCSDVEMETSNMTQTVLEASTEKSLLLRVNQKLKNLPTAERGGLVLFKLIMDEIHKCTFESKQALIDWLLTFSIKNFNGEDVKVALTRFKAVVLTLGSDSPSDPCRLLLKGMKQASSEEFQGTCTSQLGMLDTVMYKDWKRRECPSAVVELDILGDTLTERFTAISEKREWTGVSHKVGAFKAELAQKAEVVSSSSTGRTGRLPFQQWFDSQTCKVPHCGGKHPTKYHNDLEARERPPPPLIRRNGTNNRKPVHNRQSSNRQNPRTPRFKSNESEKSFRKKVYNAVCEAFVDEDHELFAHLAGGTEEDGDEGFESAVEEVEVEEAEDGMMANAAISLDQLLNW
jgi:hypothetical protein